MLRFFKVLSVLLALFGVGLHWLGFRYGVTLAIAGIAAGVALFAGRTSEDRKSLPPSPGD